MDAASFFKKHRFWFGIVAVVFITGLLLLSGKDLAIANCVGGNENRVTVMRTLEPFQRMVLEGQGELIIKEGDEQSFEVEIDENLLPLLDISVSKGLLTIGSKSCFSNDGALTIRATLPKLEEVTLAGSGSVQGLSTFHSEQIALNIMGNGDVEMKMEVDTLKSSVLGSGDMALSGKAKISHMIIRGSGDIEAPDLEAQRSFITISGSGDVETTVIEGLKVNITGSGNVIYNGRPQDISLDVKGSGRVERGG